MTRKGGPKMEKYQEFFFCNNKITKSPRDSTKWFILCLYLKKNMKKIGSKFQNILSRAYHFATPLTDLTRTFFLFVSSDELCTGKKRF